MIAFAVCVGSDERCVRYVAPGLRLACEPDSVVAEVTTDESIFKAYNSVLDALCDRPDLEALVLMHDDVEIVDADLCAKLRRRMAEPDVAVVGVVGALGPPSLEWWKGGTRGRVRETRGVIDFGGGTHDVDMVDGLLMALSPWAVRNLRFDEERFSGFHGYDADFCFQARRAGKRVLVDELGVVHHTKGGYGDREAFDAAEQVLNSKWAASQQA